ncbi:hypothetical protein ABW20_dc0110625 [Dactylellina cionopaga]|nr:hypothetical protein ABW20_dc0110625 [Dactylellina cionopaga]
MNTTASDISLSPPPPSTKEFERFASMCRQKFEKSNAVGSTESNRWKFWYRLAAEIDTTIAYKFDQAANIAEPLARSAGSEYQTVGDTPLKRLKWQSRALVEKWAGIILKVEISIDLGHRRDIEEWGHLFEKSRTSVRQMKEIRESIETIVNDADGVKREGILSIIQETLWEWDKMFKAWEAHMDTINKAEKRQQERINLKQIRGASGGNGNGSGLRQRKSYRPSGVSYSNDDRYDEAEDDNEDSERDFYGLPYKPPTPPPPEDPTPLATDSAIDSTFPSSFYPVSAARATSSILTNFFYDRNTLWFMVFILALTSGIFSGMAFFNPMYPLYSSLS